MQKSLTYKLPPYLAVARRKAGGIILSQERKNNLHFLDFLNPDEESNSAHTKMKKDFTFFKKYICNTYAKSK